MQVRVCEHLPEACGGGVVMVDEEGVRWLLVEPYDRWYPTMDCVDLAAWRHHARQVLGAGEPLTVIDMAAWAEVDPEIVRGVWQVSVFDYWQEMAVA